MTDLFSYNKQANLFDNLMVDVPKVYEDYPLVKESDAGVNKVLFATGFFHRIYRCPLVPAKYRGLALRGFRQIGLDQGWFLEFRKYWSGVLKGRPLWAVDDLYFLKNLYRIKFQSSNVPDETDAQGHCKAWQRPEVIYQLLHLVCKEAIADQLGILRKLAAVRPDFKKLKMLEFGCATAPITASLYNFYKPKSLIRMYISDIQTLAFHYATYRFRRCSNVIPVLLRPEDDFALKLDDKLDVIFCITVFEHLNQPLQTAKTLYNLLSSGGILFFDYIKSDGLGFDTQKGVKERDPVIDFIGDKFVVVEGELSKEKDIHLTVVRKK
jgi:2-polyprenyl-3-methyl-5-hydroxy-6-metoxy-1,4-benzoquinol methylase